MLKYSLIKIRFIKLNVNDKKLFLYVTMLVQETSI